jgi:hypothetical protein
MSRRSATRACRPRPVTPRGCWRPSSCLRRVGAGDDSVRATEVTGESRIRVRMARSSKTAGVRRRTLPAARPPRRRAEAARKLAHVVRPQSAGSASSPIAGRMRRSSPRERDHEVQLRPRPDR